jgi:hypothetical protein
MPTAVGTVGPFAHDGDGAAKKRRRSNTPQAEMPAAPLLVQVATYQLKPSQTGACTLCNRAQRPGRTATAEPLSFYRLSVAGGTFEVGCARGAAPNRRYDSSGVYLQRRR